MSARGDQIREPLPEEKHTSAKLKQEYQVRKAYEAAQQKAEYDHLIEQMDKEAIRIAGVLRNADWSKARLVASKDHWWQRAHEHAYLRFADDGGRPTYRSSLWMRADSVLHIEVDGRLYRPENVFQYSTDWLLTNVTLLSMRIELHRLQTFTSLDSPPAI